MLKRNWPCNVSCSLCYYINETTAHLLTRCNNSEATWNLVANSFNLPNYDIFSADHSPSAWVKTMKRAGSKRDKRRNLGILAMFWWTIWKEGNRRIFEDKECQPSVIADLTSDLVHLNTAADINHLNQSSVLSA
jgi:hypothetical protein